MTLWISYTIGIGRDWHEHLFTLTSMWSDSLEEAEAEVEQLHPSDDQSEKAQVRREQQPVRAEARVGRGRQSRALRRAGRSTIEGYLLDSSGRHLLLHLVFPANQRKSLSSVVAW